MMLSKIKKLASIFNEQDNSLTNKTIQNSVYSFAAAVVSRLGALVFMIILARALLPDLFGIYSLTFSVISTVFIFTDLGINSGLSRYLADSLAKGKAGESEARSRFRFMFKLKIFLVLLAAFILFILAPLLSSFIFNKPELTAPLQVGALFIFTAAIQGFLGSVFYPLKKLKYSFISEIIFQLSRICICVLFLYLFKTVPSVFWALILASFLSCIFYLLVIIVKQKWLLLGKLIPVERRRISIFLGWAIILSTSLAAFSYIGSIMLGIFIPSKFIGFYNIILSIVNSVIALISFSSVFTPVFTEIKTDRLKRGFNKVIKYTLILAIPAAIGLAFVTVPAIKIIYGIEYVPEEFYYPIFISSIIIALLAIESPISGIYGALFTAKEKLKFPAVVMASLTVLNIILNYVFITFALSFGQAWALVAVASATLLTRYLNLFIIIFIAKKKLKLSAPLSSFTRPLFASVIMFIALAIFQSMKKTTWPYLIVEIIFGAFVYLIAITLIEKIIKDKY